MAFSDFFCSKRILNKTTVAILRNSNHYRNMRAWAVHPLIAVHLGSQPALRRPSPYVRILLPVNWPIAWR
jgi:hypothetical protein